MRLLFYCAIQLLAIHLCAQENIKLQADSILQEGKNLYRLEKASWHGTDIFLSKYKDQENLGGYFSYPDQNTTKCIFFSKGTQPKVIGSISFDSSCNLQNAITDLTQRDLTPEEKEIYKIRTGAINLLRNDTFYTRYPNISFNPIPVITNNERKVYVLSGSQQQGVAYFGNDYLIRFDQNNNVVSRKRLHKTLIPMAFGNNNDGQLIIGGVHTHLPENGDLITATDICTLLLYQNLTGWKEHYVIGSKYVSSLDCIK